MADPIKNFSLSGQRAPSASIQHDGIMDCVLARLSQNVTNKYFSYSAMPAVPMALVFTLGRGFGLCRCMYKHRRVEIG